KNTAVHFDWRFSGGRPSTDWLGRGARAAGPRSLVALRHGLPLAIPALHGHRLDVSRRLCPRGISGFAIGRAERLFCDLAERGSFAVPDPTDFGSDDRWRIRSALLGRGANTCFVL